MTTAGLYETSGDWLYDVGLPGKSGIGGGIVTVSPGKGGLGTFAPRLDAAGNSVKGQLAARFLSAQLGLDLFASEPERVRALAPRPRRASRSSRRRPPPARARRTSRRSPQRYAPVVRLVAQAHECGTGESYEPIDVNTLFGEPTVALRGPVGRDDLVKIAPDRERSHARPLRVPPRLPRQRARPGLRLRALGAADHRRERSRRSTRTSRPIPPTRASSRCSTGSSTSSTTGTTRTRATGR